MGARQPDGPARALADGGARRRVADRAGYARARPRVRHRNDVDLPRSRVRRAGVGHRSVDRRVGQPGTDRRRRCARPRRADPRRGARVAVRARVLRRDRERRRVPVLRHRRSLPRFDRALPARPRSHRHRRSRDLRGDRRDRARGVRALLGLGVLLLPRSAVVADALGEDGQGARRRRRRAPRRLEGLAPVRRGDRARPSTGGAATRRRARRRCCVPTRAAYSASPGSSRRSCNRLSRTPAPRREQSRRSRRRRAADAPSRRTRRPRPRRSRGRR